MLNCEKIPEVLKKFLPISPPSLLFEGSNRAEIEYSAFSFAKALLKTEKKCPADLRVLEPEGKGGYHSIQAIKQLIKEAQILPYEAPYKVFILHQAERMLPGSSNALLKILEEPPPQVTLILLTSDKKNLLSTVVSRCFCVSLKEQNKLEDSALSEAMFAIGLKLLKKEFSINNEVPDVEDLEKALSYLFYFYRDLQLVQLGGDPSFLFFKGKEAILASIQSPAPSLSSIQEKVETVLLATTLHISLKHALVMLL